MKKSKFSTLAIALTCLSLLFAACSKQEGDVGNSGEAAEGDKVLKLAVTVPLTGGAAKAGIEIRDTVAMVLENENYKVGDYTIEPIWCDVTTDPEKAALALEQAIVRDGAQVAILGWNSSIVLSLMDVVAKYKIPYFFEYGGYSGLIDEKWQSDPEKYSYFIGKGMPRPELLASKSYINVITEAIEDGSFTPANRNIATYGEDSDWGRSIGGAIRDSFVDAGWNKVYEDYTAEGNTDFFAVLSKIKASDPAIIAGSITSPASSAAFIKQARELDINAVIIADGLVENADYYELTSDSVNYVLDSRPIWTDKNQFVADAFEEKYGYTPAAANGGLAYDYTNLFIKCCEKTIEMYGVLDSESLHKFAAEVLMVGDFAYTDGVIFDCYNWTAETAPSPMVGEGYHIFPVLQLMGNDINVVWPDSQANAEFQLP
jgi:branched-chain amino acid transport system substrate-binding protein